MRRRYRYDEATRQVVEVPPDWEERPRRAPVPSEEATYGTLRATDGTALDTRRKHREYMRARNLSLCSDWTETWRRAEKERAQALSGPEAKRERREDIARAYHELRERKRNHE